MLNTQTENFGGFEKGRVDILTSGIGKWILESHIGK